MSTLAYLDSARMGLMCERARLAHIDYIRLAGLEGCSLYFELFLRRGFDFWPPSLQEQFPGLSDWRGPAELKARLRSFALLSSDVPVLLANRSAQLMRLAAQMLSEKSRRILVTDLTWPGYRRILKQQLQRRGGKRRITTVRIRDEILYSQASVADVIERIAAHYTRRGCDGIFLPAVSHSGIRLPLDHILEALQRIRLPRLTVVDGAQALGHVPDQLGLEHCDLFIAGCHKWLQCHVPMGVGFCPSQETSRRIASTCRRTMLTGELDDPLLSFVEQLESDSANLLGETVSLSSLFATRAALAASSEHQQDLAATFNAQLKNAERLACALADTKWTPLLPEPEFRSGILLLKLDEPPADMPSAKRLRLVCLACGLAVTAYNGGLIRLTMPGQSWTERELESVCRALRSCAHFDSGAPLPPAPMTLRARRCSLQPSG